MFCFISIYLYKRFAVVNSVIEYMNNNPTSIANATILCNSTDYSPENANNIACDQIDIVLELPDTPWVRIVFGLFVISVTSFLIFYRRINKAYRWTFFDTRSGKQFLCDKFESSTTDQARFDIFGSHPSYYRSIEPKLKEYLNDNWSKWEEESPVWFTAAASAKVPSYMLPSVLIKRHGGAEGARDSIRKSVVKEKKDGDKRRASAVQIIPLG